MNSHPDRPMVEDPICGVSSLGSQSPVTEPDEAKEDSAGAADASSEASGADVTSLFEGTAESAKRAIEEKSRHLTEAVLWRLRQARQRGALLRRAPDRMRRAADQLELCIELITDMRTGAYREVSWPKALIISGAILYSVSPADLVPDVLPALGSIDDAIVLSLAVSLARDELMRYCEFKGFDTKKYFPDDAS